MSTLNPETIIRQIGPKLSKNNRSLSKQQKESLRLDICQNPGFCTYLETKRDWTHEEHDNLLNILELPKNDMGYYIDVYGERVSYNGIKSLKRADTELPITRAHMIEINKVKNDLKYFREYYSFIITRDGLKRPELREYQEDMENAYLSMKDVVILSGRQIGKTVVSGIYLLWRTLQKENINIGIVANRGETSREVLNKIKNIFIEMPIWLQLGVEVWNKGSVYFDNNVRILTDVPSSDAFRGHTLNLLYGDEFAYLDSKDKYDEFVDSIIPTMSSLVWKQAIFTSTPNGMNYFANLCKVAEINDDYEFLKIDWRHVPRYDKDGNKMTPEEYMDSVIKKNGLKFFKQTVSAEFLGSSDSLVSGSTLLRIQNHLESIRDEEYQEFEFLKIYKKPIKGRNYIISVDPSKGAGDAFSVIVTDITKFPFEQVASSNMFEVDHLSIPERLVNIGEYYNNGLIVVENTEGAGQSVIDTIWYIYNYENVYRDKNVDGRVGYKRYPGFRTTTKTRSVILGFLKTFLNDQKLIVNDEEFLEQLYVFNKQENGKYEADAGYHDDLIMCQAIMFAPFMESKMYDDYETFVKDLKLENPTERRVDDYLSTLSFSDDGDDRESNYERTKKALEEAGSLDSFSEYGIPETMQDSLRDLWT